MKAPTDRDNQIVSAVAVFGATLPLLAMTFVGLQEGANIAAKMARDLAAIAEISPFYGSLSAIGALVWFASGALSMFVALCLRDRLSRTDTGFLTLGSLLSFYLALDDYFMFHEEIAPRYLGLGEPVVIGFLVFAVGAYLVAFRRQILATRFLWLVAALGLFGGSVLVDAVIEPLLTNPSSWIYVVEDGLKWVGIVCWARYHFGVCQAAVRSRLVAADPASKADMPQSVSSALQEIRERLDKARAA